MIRHDEIKPHEAPNIFASGDGIDPFDVDIPPDERYMSAHVEVIATGLNPPGLGQQVGGDARLDSEPAVDSTGRVTVRVRWWYQANFAYPALVEYRIRVFTRHKDDSVTFLQGMEPLTARRKLVVMGDGFSASEQEDFNEAVRRMVLEGVFSHDLFRESVQAFSVWRVNLISPESPVSERIFDEKGTSDDPRDDTLVSETIRHTALDCIVEGVWSHGWFDLSHSIQIEQTLQRMVPDYDYSITICNNPGPGGVSIGPHQVVTSGGGWATMAHEFGHSIGALLDEYSIKGLGAYEDGEPSAVNVTIATSRPDLKWAHFVEPLTPIPTGRGAAAEFTEGPKPATWSNTDDAGLFEGGAVMETGISRPVINCRMNTDIAAPYCPVCYTEVKDRLHPYSGHTFTSPLVGDFDGSGQHDLILVMGPGLHRYRRNADQFELTLSAAGQLAGGWSLEAGDRYIVADFDGDGADEILVYRYRSQPRMLALLKSDGAGGLRLVWSQTAHIGTWTFGYGDQLLPANWSSTGGMNLFWIKPGEAVALIKFTPSGFRKVQSYTQTLPGWWLDGSETFLAGDFDGQGRDDLFVYSGAPGHPTRAAVFRVETPKRVTVLIKVVYDESRFSDWAIGSNDQWFAANWHGGQQMGLYVYNGVDWQRPMLATVWANTTSGHLRTDTVYDGSLPGWYLGRNDRFTVAGPRGNLPQGLLAFNSDDWVTEMLGVVMSDGSNLSALRTFHMPDWTMSGNDRFLPCNLSTATADTSSLLPDTIVHTNDRLAIINNRHLTVRESYFRWIHHYRYGKNS